MFRVFKAKILNAPVCTKCPVNFFRRSIIRPVQCERHAQVCSERSSSIKL